VAALIGGGLLPYLVALGLGGLGTLIVAFRRDTSWGPVPPLTVAIALTALTCFGGGGILALRLFSFGSGRGLVAALIFALLGAALFGGLAFSVRRSVVQGTEQGDLIGALASVTIAIEPGKPGAIVPRFTTPPRTLVATSAADRTLPVGTVVVVTAVRGAPGQEAAEVAQLSQGESTQAAD
jgi:hypothetical protein